MADKRTAPALAWGMAVGLIVSVGVAIIGYLLLSSVGDGAIVKSVVVLIFLPAVLPGIAAGVTAHVLLLRTGWTPRSTWLMLTALFIAASFLVWIIFTLLSGVLYQTIFSTRGPARWLTAVQILLQIVQAITVFGVWFFFGTLGLQKTLARPDEGVLTKKTEAIWIAIMTAVNLLGFVMIGPFTPFTFFIGLPAGLLVIVYASWKTVSPSSNVPGRVITGLLAIANVYILYLSLRFL